MSVPEAFAESRTITPSVGLPGFHGAGEQFVVAGRAEVGLGAAGDPARLSVTPSLPTMVNFPLLVSVKMPYGLSNSASPAPAVTTICTPMKWPFTGSWSDASSPSQG